MNRKTRLLEAEFLGVVLWRRIAIANVLTTFILLPPSFPHWPWCLSSPPPSLLYPALIPPQLSLNIFSYRLPAPSSPPCRSPMEAWLQCPPLPSCTPAVDLAQETSSSYAGRDHNTDVVFNLDWTSKILCPLLSHPWHFAHFHSNNPKPSYLFYPATSICEILRKKNHWWNQQLVKYKNWGGRVCRTVKWKLKTPQH